MASPKKLPTKLKVLRGTNQPCRTLPNEMQGTFLTDIPPAPDVLGEAGKFVWETVGQSLVRTGILLKEDLLVFKIYCTLADSMNDLEIKLKKEREMCEIKMLESKTGRPIYLKTKTLSSYLNCQRAVISVASEFGLTPSARASIPAASKPNKQRDKEYEMFGN